MLGRRPPATTGAGAKESKKGRVVKGARGNGGVLRKRSTSTIVKDLEVRGRRFEKGLHSEDDAQRRSAQMAHSYLSRQKKVLLAQTQKPKSEIVKELRKERRQELSMAYLSGSKSSVVEALRGRKKSRVVSHLEARRGDALNLWHEKELDAFQNVLDKRVKKNEQTGGQKIGPLAKSLNNLTVRSEKLDRVQLGKVGPTPKFEYFGLEPRMCESLVKDYGFKEASISQQLGVPEIMKKHDVLFAGETGSGKTFAYMLPLFHMLQRQEVNEGYVPKLRHPRVIVLAPTKELCLQTRRMISSFKESHVRSVNAMKTQGFADRISQEPFDIWVATPHRILDVLVDKRERCRLSLSEVRHLVIDEADMMFQDEEFFEQIQKIVKQLNSTRQSHVTIDAIRAQHPDLQLALKNKSIFGTPDYQIIAMTCTLPPIVTGRMGELSESFKLLRTRNVHRPLPNVSYAFFRLTATDTRQAKLKELMEEEVLKRNKRVVIFCQTSKSMEWVGGLLDNMEIDHSRLAGMFKPGHRQKSLNRFLTRDNDVLVTTDAAAKGLDFECEHVIMFDQTRDVSDFIARAGRTGRMGKRGKVTCLMHRRGLGENLTILNSVRKNNSFNVLSLKNATHVDHRLIGDKHDVKNLEGLKKRMLLDKLLGSKFKDMPKVQQNPCLVQRSKDFASIEELAQTPAIAELLSLADTTTQASSTEGAEYESVNRSSY
eukprot:Nk52_evm3s2531 gene=Nk52_evmTU3s2531